MPRYLCRAAGNARARRRMSPEDFHQKWAIPGIFSSGGETFGLGEGEVSGSCVMFRGKVRIEVRFWWGTISASFSRPRVLPLRSWGANCHRGQPGVRNLGLRAGTLALDLPTLLLVVVLLYAAAIMHKHMIVVVSFAVRKLLLAVCVWDNAAYLLRTISHPENAPCRRKVIPSWGIARQNTYTHTYSE